jgi:hypothetical protein
MKPAIKIFALLVGSLTLGCHCFSAPKANRSDLDSSFKNEVIDNYRRSVQAHAISPDLLFQCCDFAPVRTLRIDPRVVAQLGVTRNQP